METLGVHCRVRKLLRNKTLCKDHTTYNKQTSTSHKMLQNQLLQHVCKQGEMTSRSALYQTLTLKLSSAQKCWRYVQFRLMIGEETNEIQEN